MTLRAGVDGVVVVVRDGATVLDAIRAAGTGIPSLCSDERLRPYGSCRVCMVGLEGHAGPVPACSTPVMDGARIDTRDSGAIETARGALELIVSTLPERALDLPSERSELVRACEALGVDRGRFTGERRTGPRDDSHPYLK